ncbi:hypothetical protein Tco_1491022 [Tanacetum coccineum]
MSLAQRKYFSCDIVLSWIVLEVLFDVACIAGCLSRMLRFACLKTKEDRESQLYDEFELFKMLPGENINEYYVRFHKLVNDMRNIRMTMPNIQLNSKFMNNMSPYMGWLVDSHVKTQQRLKEIKSRTVLFTDGRVVVPNVKGDRIKIKVFCLRNGSVGNGGAQIRLGKPIVGQGNRSSGIIVMELAIFAGTVLSQASHKILIIFPRTRCLLMASTSRNGAVLDEEELLFLAGEQGNTFDADVDNQPVQDLALNEDNIFQADECDAFDSDVDDDPDNSVNIHGQFCPQSGQQIHKLSI